MPCPKSTRQRPYSVTWHFDMRHSGYWNTSGGKNLRKPGHTVLATTAYCVVCTFTQQGLASSPCVVYEPLAA